MAVIQNLYFGIPLEHIPPLTAELQPLKPISGGGNGDDWCMSVTKCWQLNFIEYPLIIPGASKTPRMSECPC